MKKQNKYIRHGLRYHPLYKVWDNIKGRCLDKNNKDYKDYGGRGITVYSKWKDNLKVFIDWAIDNGYKRGLQIDREDNNGNYTPNNCRFVTSATNNQNRRNTKLNWSLVRGIRLCGSVGFLHKEIAGFYGVSRPTITDILNNKIWRI